MGKISDALTILMSACCCPNNNRGLNIMPRQTPNMAAWSVQGKLLDFLTEQSLLTRAERARQDGQQHLRHWSTPIVFLLMRALTVPLENRVVTATVIALLLFAPIF